MLAQEIDASPALPPAKRLFTAWSGVPDPLTVEIVAGTASMP